MSSQFSRKFNQLITLLCLSSLTWSQTFALTPQNIMHSVHSLPDAVTTQVRQNTTFSYDLAGNILIKTVDGHKTTYHYNAINQLISIHQPDGTVMDLANDYDALGSMRQDSDGNHYQYDLFGQLVQFQNNHTGVKSHYQYYANGLRSQKRLVSNPMADSIDYYYQGSDIVNEKQGQSTTSYLLPSGHMVRYLHDGQGNLQKQIAIHGSKDVDAILNGQGKIERSYHYSPKQHSAN